MIEFVNYHSTAFGVVDKPELKKMDGNGTSLEAALKGQRKVNFDELGYHECPIYERSLLPVNIPIQGPLVIEEPAATTVVFPDQKVTRDDYGFLNIELTS